MSDPCLYPPHKPYLCVIELSRDGRRVTHHFTDPDLDLNPLTLCPDPDCDDLHVYGPEKESYAAYTERVREWERPFRSIDLLRQRTILDGRLPWLWEGYIRPGELTMLAALMKAGKTTLVFHLLSAMESGVPFLGRPTREARVIYVTEEPDGIFLDRIEEDHPCLRGSLIHVSPESGWDGPAVLQAVDQALTFYKQKDGDDYPVLVILDTASRLLRIDDENNNALVAATFGLVRDRARSTGAAFLLVQHTNKNARDTAQVGLAARGAGAGAGEVDHVLELFREGDKSDPAEKRRVLRAVGRSKHTPPELRIRYNPANKKYDLLTYSDRLDGDNNGRRNGHRDTRREVLELHARGRAQRAIAEELKIAPSTVAEHLKNAGHIGRPCSVCSVDARED